MPDENSWWNRDKPRHDKDSWWKNEKYVYWCNECDWEKRTDKHTHDFCPNCGHVNISRSTIK